MPRGKCIKPDPKPPKKPVALSWEDLPNISFNASTIAHVRLEHIRHLIPPPSQLRSLLMTV